MMKAAKGKTIYHKCDLDGCEKIVRQTASMRRLGRGRFCSKKHCAIAKYEKNSNFGFHCSIAIIILLTFL